jgi:hypothetical protein
VKALVHGSYYVFAFSRAIAIILGDPQLAWLEMKLPNNWKPSRCSYKIDVSKRKKNTVGFTLPQVTMYITEGSLEVKLPAIWTDGKAEVGSVREEKSRREKIREEKE